MKKNACAKCGGILVKQKIDYEKKVGEKRALFEAVPASVCTSCDEVWLDAMVAEKIEEIFNKSLKPTRWVKVPLWSLSRLT
ncbi:MAG: YgiT-type zinc finger protein [Deltaproteobacteria bacterium]|nr:YgiT-type zinc finger protein [Deltaproteobacteria bacterium]